MGEPRFGEEGNSKKVGGVQNAFNPEFIFKEGIKLVLQMA